jgi:uncharacterized delta-60 repeat protein
MTLRGAAAFLMFAAAIVAPCHADGTVILDFNQNQPDYVTRLRVNSDDSFHVQVGHEDGSLIQPICDFFRMGADGTLISTFGTGGRLSTGECAKDFSVRSNGALDMLDASGLYLQFRDASGALVSTSGRIFPVGTVDGYRSAASALLRLSNGQFMAGGYAGVCFACDPGDLDWALARLNADGSVDSSFANGLLRKPSQRNLRTLVELPDAKVLGAGHALAFGDATELSRFDATGLDFTYGLNAQVTVNLGVARIAVDSTGRAYVVGQRGEVVRVNSNGTVDGTYATATPTPPIMIDAIAVDSMGRVVVFGGTQGQNSQAQIRRFTSAGALDTTFNGTGVVTFSFPQPIGYAPYVSPCTGALQSLDRPLIACRVDNLNGQDLAVARFTDTGQLDVTFGANQLDTDLYPDAFSFPDTSAPYGSVGVVSAEVTVSGFDAGRETNVVASAGLQYSVGCNGIWTSTTGLIVAGETLCVRQNASATPGDTATHTIRVGGRQASFTVLSTSTAADSIPDPFTFTAQTNSPLDTVVTSNNITVQGITGYSTATATNGTFSIGCTGSFVTSSIYITNGTELCVRHTTSSQFATSVTTTLSVGGVSAPFTSTTLAPDLTPDAFTFTAQTNVVLNTLTDSNTITVSGINGVVAVSVTGGEYSVGCTSPNFTTTASTVGIGQTVCVRHTTSAQYSTSVTTTLTIGGVAASFTSTTASAPSNGGGSGGGGGGGAIDELLLAGLGLCMALSFLERHRRRLQSR